MKGMSKFCKMIVFVLAAVITAMTTALYAGEGSGQSPCPDGTYTNVADGIAWAFTVSGGQASVGCGWNMTAVPSDTEGEVVVPTVLGGCPVIGIGDYAFMDCGGLTSIVLPSGLTEIGALAFWDCGLTSISIPEGVRSMGHSVFYGCRSITSIALPSTLEVMGFDSFNYCRNLASLTVSSANTNFTVVGGILYDKAVETLICCPATLTAVAIPNTVRHIGRSAFNGCDALTEIDLPSSVMEIAENAFYWCDGLTDVVLPNGVQSIGTSAFAACAGLRSVTIPSSVSTVGHNAFADCPNLDTVYVERGEEERVSGLLAQSGLDVSRVTLVGSWDKSLVISPDRLPDGAVGQTYSATLTADGGVRPYVWHVRTSQKAKGAGYSECCATSTFASTGTAKGWKADDQCWSYALPFAFSFYDKIYTTAYISSNGTLSFDEGFSGYQESHDELKNHAMIAVMWDDLKTNDGDVYVASSSDAVTVRWSGTSYSAGGAVNFAVTLYADGHLQMSYGSGNANGGLVGISAGDGENYHVCECSQKGGLANAQDVILMPAVGEVHYGLPQGLTLSEDGALSGTPTEVASNVIDVVVTDARGWQNHKEIALVVTGSMSTVTFDLGEHGSRIGGGELVQRVVNGCAAVAPMLSVSASWKLTGWDRDFSCITNDCTVKACYETKVLPDGTYSEVIDGIEWTYVISKGKAVVGGGSSSELAVPKSTAGTIEIPSAFGRYPVVGINNDAFYYCGSIVGIEIPECITSIGNRAFCGTGLRTVVIPGSVRTMGEHVFAWTPITSAVIEEGVPEIGAFAFRGCSALATIKIPSSVLNIGQYAFASCPRLGSGVVIVDDCVLTVNGVCPSHLTIPEGTRLITGHVFYDYAEELKSVSIPSSMVTIGDWAFFGCTNLTSVVMNGCINIGKQAFRDCLRLRNLTIPEGIKSIHENAFLGCENLSCVYFNGDAPEIVGDGIYSGTSDSLITFVKRRSVGWKKHGALGLPPFWPGIGNYSRLIEYRDLGDVLTHVVEFTLGDHGSVVDGEVYQIVEDCCAASAPDVEPDAGWLFDGWDKRFGCVTNNMTVTARYKPCAQVPVRTSVLPVGKEMTAYATILESEDGGQGEWVALVDDYEVVNRTSTYSQTGESYGWSGTFSSWEYELPFDFEFYGTKWSTVYVNDNGTLTFDCANDNVTADVDNFTQSKMIAPLYTWYGSEEGYVSDVCILEDDDKVCFRWLRYSVYLDKGIGFSATLYRSGEIRLSYEYGVEVSTGSYASYIVGVSAGDGVRNTSVARRVQDSSDVVFVPSYTESQDFLPNGLVLDSDGSLRGVPTTAGKYSIKIGYVLPLNDMAVCEYPLVIESNPNGRPEVEGTVPSMSELVSVGTNCVQTFSVFAHDPEGEVLTYQWYLDGVPVLTDTNGVYRLVAKDLVVGNHVLVCDVSDGMWVDEVKCSWNVAVLRTHYVTPETDFISLERQIGYSDCIVFAPGEYEFSDMEEMLMFGGRLRLESECGPNKTIMKGAPEYMHGRATFKGFTFTDGMEVMDGCFEDCVFKGCDGLRFEYGTLINCCLTGNRGLVMRGMQVSSSTIIDNSADGDGLWSEMCTFVNSIVMDLMPPDIEMPGYEYGYGTTFDHCCLNIVETNGVGNICADPMLVAPEAGDFRLRSGSPCIDAGTFESELSVTDINGNIRVRGIAPDIGATEGTVSGHVVSATIVGCGKLKEAVVVVPDGESATLEVLDGVRPFDHFEVNGEFVTNEKSLTINNVFSDCMVTAVFSNYNFYVDSAVGDDDNDGLSREKAFRSIQKAIDVAVAGEAISVLPGRYSPIESNNKLISIKSEQGRDVTFIDALNTSNRCAMLAASMSGTNTLLKGFTLCNGFVRVERNRACGGGAYGGTIEDCVISNCVAECLYEYGDAYGGAVYGGVLRRCVIVSNSAIAGYYAEGGGAYESLLTECLVAGNLCRARTAEGGGAYISDLYGCTVSGNTVVNTASSTALTGRGAGLYISTAYNSIIFNNYSSSSTGTSRLIDNSYSSTFESCCQADPKFVDADMGNYSLAADSPCVDAGNNAYVVDTLDLEGNPRLSGVAVDIGAYEYQQTAIMPLDVVVDGVMKTYDGVQTSVVVRVDASVVAPVEVRYSIDGCAWTADVPLFVNATNAFVWVAASATGYSSVTNRAQVAIMPRVVIVTAGSKQKTYDGMPLTSHEFSTFGFVPGEGIASAMMTPESAIVEVGEVANVIANVVPAPGTLLSNYGIRFETGLLKVIPATMPSLDNVEESEPFDPHCPRPPVPPVSTSGELLVLSDYDFIGTYDGQGHTLDAFALLCEIMDQPLLFAANFEMSYSVDGVVWRSDPFVYTNVVETSFWYRVSAPNMTSGIHAVGVTVLPRPATVTAGSASKTYDGAPLFSSDFIATGFLEGEGVLSATMTPASTITEVGSVDNVIESVVLLPNTLRSNYVIAYQPGTLEVTDDIHLPIGEAVNAADYEWLTDGDLPWRGEKSSTAADGVHHAVVRGLGNSASSFVQTTVFGSGVIAFTWSSVTSSKNTKVQFLVDDEVAGMLMGNADRTDAEFRIAGEGEHILKWRVSTGRSGSTDEDMVTLDQVVWKPDHEPNLGEALNPDLEWTTSGDGMWKARSGVSGAVGSCAVVTGLGDLQTASLKTKVYGDGVLSFSWAVSCEDEYDWMELTVDGEVYSYVTGHEDWCPVIVPVTGRRWHTICWEYVKDEMDEPELVGLNRAMVDEVVWMTEDVPPEDGEAHERTATGNTPVPVPYSVFENASFKVYLDAANGDYEVAAMATGKNGCPIWESFVAGLDPEKPSSKFTTKIEIVNGKPVVTWEPALNGTNDDGTCIKEGVRLYELKGSNNLKDWSTVPEKGEDSFSFFKVEVSMPLK